MAADYGLADAKKVVDRALIEESAQLEVEGLAEAKLVAQELADFGAIVSCDGIIFDSFLGDERGIRYRRSAVGTVVMEGTTGTDAFSGRLVSGTILEHFDLSVPINASLDFRIGARLVSQTNDRISFAIDCEDIDEI